MRPIFTFLLLLVANFAAQAQAYIPFPTANAIWTERQGKGDTTPAYHCYGLKNEDTVIGSVTYHRIFRSDDAVFTSGECIGGLREDSRKIYFYDFASGKERLAFDFSLNIGDTVKSYYGPDGVVSYFDSVNIAGTYHRRTNFMTHTGHPWPSGSWIEGIGNGSLGGMFGSAMAQPTCDCGSNIICFGKDGNWDYHNPAMSSLDCIPSAVKIDESFVRADYTPLHPNPVTGVSYIFTAGQFERMDIIDMRGALIKSLPLTPGQEEIKIEKSNFASGIYYYRLYNNYAGRTTVGKFVIN